MVQKIIWGLILIFLLGVAAASGAVWKLHTVYMQAKQALLTETNQTLAPYQLSLECQSGWQWLQLQENDLCSLRHEGELTLLFKQQITFLPWQLTSTFSLTPVYKGIHLEGQQGSWQLPLGASRIHFNAHANGSFNTRKIKFNDWRMRGWVSLDNEYKSHIELEFEQLLLSLQDENLEIAQLLLSFDTKQVNHHRFIERSGLSFKSATFTDAENTLWLHNFELENANLPSSKEGLSMLFNTELQGIKRTGSQSDLRLDPTSLSLYFDFIDINLQELWRSQNLAINISNNISRLYSNFKQQAHKNGLSLNIEKISSGLSYQDKTPDLLGMSGDFNIDGAIRLQADDSSKDSLRLNIDLSDSLMLGPQVDLMWDFIEQGWIYQRKQRLISRILLSNGKLFANGQVVSALALWPPTYEDDH